MFEIKRAFKLLRRTLLPVVLAGLVWLSGLPAATSAQAAPSNFGGQGQDLSKAGNRPYGERETATIKQANKGDNSVAEQATERVKELVNQNDSNRPKTVGQWYDDARKTNDAPGERLQKIGEQSKEALKDFGALYPDTAKRSADSLDENTQR